MKIPTAYAHGGPLHEFESDPESYESPAIKQAATPEVVLVSIGFIILVLGTIFLVKRKQK